MGIEKNALDVSTTVSLGFLHSCMHSFIHLLYLKPIARTIKEATRWSHLSKLTIARVNLLKLVKSCFEKVIRG